MPLQNRGTARYLGNQIRTVCACGARRPTVIFKRQAMGPASILGAGCCVAHLYFLLIAEQRSET